MGSEEFEVQLTIHEESCCADTVAMTRAKTMENIVDFILDVDVFEGVWDGWA